MKSSLRPDNRYVLIAVHGVKFEEGMMRGELARWMNTYFGIEGLARVHPSIMKVNVAEQKVILRCRRGEEQSLIAGLALCASLGGAKAHLEAVRVSGTIAALIRKEGKKEEKKMD